MKRSEWLNAARPAQLRRLCTDLLRPGKPQVEQKDAGQIINSPLFAALIERLQAAGRCAVLDLGPAVGANVAFFGNLHCRLQIADCTAALSELKADDAVGSDDYAAELAAILPLAELEPCDAILAWDILNYLDKPLFKALMNHLSPIVSGDTWLHAYIGARREMSAVPLQYRLDEQGRVIATATASMSCSCPCYPQQELRTLMPRFAVAHSRLLQNGMQEYLFRGQGRGHRSPGR